MPLEFERKRVVVPCAKKVVHFKDFVINKQKIKYIEREPKSVLDIVNSSPGPPTSISTGGGGGGLTAVSGDQFTKWSMPENQETCSSNVGFFDPHQRLPGKCLDITGAEEKCGEMEDWESVLSESGQEQSILRWIMGDVEDPSMGLHKMLHGGGTADSGELSGEFGIVDQGYFGFDSNNPVGQFGNFLQIPHKFTNEKFGLSQPPVSSPATAADMVTDHRHKTSGPENPFPQIHQFDVKPYKDSTFFGQVEQEHQTLVPSQPKRYNSGSIEYNMNQMPKTPFLGTPQNTIQVPLSIKKMSGIDEIGHQGIIDQLYKAAEMIQCGNNPILAQSILARLNHQLSPIGKPPFERAAFYFKEALMLLIHSLVNNMNPVSSPFSLIFKIGAYKSFSEVSPLVQFTNFTCNQAILESLDGFEHIHIVDFDIGYGDQWASFMQELALRSNNKHFPSLKITAFASHSNDHLELSLTRDNLVHFANDLKIGFDFEIVNIDVASVSWSLPVRASNKEAIAVNLPINVFSNYQVPFSLVLRFVKNLSPKIVVSVDRRCERTDLPFPNHLIHALQSFTNLLESLDAVNMNLETSQKIERFLIQPSVEKIITGRFSFPEKTQHWRSQLLSNGFSPLLFSNFTESQAVCVIKRIPVQGFHIERRQSSLVLCWQNRELVSASAWRC